MFFGCFQHRRRYIGVHVDLAAHKTSVVERERVHREIAPDAACLQYLYAVGANVALYRACHRDVVRRNVGQDLGLVADNEISGRLDAAFIDAVNANAAVGADRTPKTGRGADDCSDLFHRRSLGLGCGFTFTSEHCLHLLELGQLSTMEN